MRIQDQGCWKLSLLYKVRVFKMYNKYPRDFVCDRYKCRFDEKHPRNSLLCTTQAVKAGGNVGLGH